MDSGLCVMKGLILIVENSVSGLTLINKWRYWPKGLPAEDIILHMQLKEVGDMDAVNYVIHWKSYQITYIRDPDYIIIMMTTYGTLESF